MGVHIKLRHILVGIKITMRHFLAAVIWQIIMWTPAKRWRKNWNIIVIPWQFSRSWNVLTIVFLVYNCNSFITEILSKRLPLRRAVWLCKPFRMFHIARTHSRVCITTNCAQHYTVYSVHCALCTVDCTLHCTLYSAHYTLYNVPIILQTFYCTSSTEPSYQHTWHFITDLKGAVKQIEWFSLTMISWHNTADCPLVCSTVLKTVLYSTVQRLN